MTDHRSLGRIDLRVIDEPADPGRIDRVVGGALSRATIAPPLRTDDLLSRLGALTRPAIAAAAILLLFATAMRRRLDDPTVGAPVTSLSSWAEARRVPTNGELLAAFEGYDR